MILGGASFPKSRSRRCACRFGANSVFEEGQSFQ